MIQSCSQLKASITVAYILNTTRVNTLKECLINTMYIVMKQYWDTTITILLAKLCLMYMENSVCMCSVCIILYTIYWLKSSIYKSMWLLCWFKKFISSLYGFLIAYSKKPLSLFLLYILWKCVLMFLSKQNKTENLFSRAITAIQPL